MTEHPTAASGSPFEAIRHATPDGWEYWSARDLLTILDYDSWQKFRKVVDRAELACLNSGENPTDHFIQTDKMVRLGSGATRRIADVHLSRYACYLVIQNADPAKEIVALGQTYFAVQTRRAEQADELAGLTEAQRRIYTRYQLADHNDALADTARAAGVISPTDFAVFQNAGYRALYNGESAADIHQRKGLDSKQHILDHMGSEELGANVFRATQAEAKIRREAIQGAAAATAAHAEVGRKVRGYIADLGGTMPEDLPTPAQSIQELEQAEQKRHRQGPQLGMFDDAT